MTDVLLLICALFAFLVTLGHALWICALLAFLVTLGHALWMLHK